MNTLKKTFLLIIGLLIMISVSVAQDDEQDKVKEKKKESIKKGWNLGALPVVSYGS